MKPFRLKTVERLRGRELEDKARALHEAGAAKDQAVAERERLIAQLAGAGGPNVVGTWSGTDLDLANNFRQVLRQSIEEQADVIAHKDEALALARAAWLTARGELKAVQALHDRHRVAVAAERAHLEQRELDELAGTRRPSLRNLSSEDSEVGAR